RAALGLSREAKIDEAFFNAYLTSDRSKVVPPARPASVVAQSAPPAGPAAQPKSAAPADSGAPLSLALAADNNRTSFKPGESFSLIVRPTRDAHVYCYLQDETSRIMRFFPNRFARDSLVPAAKPLLLPGPMRFQLVMNTNGVPETIACFATQRDVSTALPASMLGIDFEPLVAGSID